MPSMTGRHLSIAVFCEKILQEADGGLSLIRMFDRYAVPAPSAEVPVQPIPLNVAIIIRSGFFRGGGTVTLVPITPNGVEMTSLNFPVQFEGDDERGAAVMINLGFRPPEAGLYWFDVRLDGDPLTRIPLRVVFQQTGPTVGPAPTGPSQK